MQSNPHLRRHQEWIGDVLDVPDVPGDGDDAVPDDEPRDVILLVEVPDRPPLVVVLAPLLVVLGPV